MKLRLGRNIQIPELFEEHEEPGRHIFTKPEKVALFREFHDLHHGIYDKADWKLFIEGKREEFERMEA